MRWHLMDEIWERGFHAVLADAVAEALDGPEHLYISIDIDSLDPAYAPGTGTPEPGGIVSADLLRMVRALAMRHHVVGFDVVEVAPAYDQCRLHRQRRTPPDDGVHRRHGVAQADSCRSLTGTRTTITPRRLSADQTASSHQSV